jgi:hypothetical protein
MTHVHAKHPQDDILDFSGTTQLLILCTIFTIRVDVLM